MFPHIYINSDRLYLPQGPHTQPFLDPVAARGALVASVQATESGSFVFGGFCFWWLLHYLVSVQLEMDSWIDFLLQESGDIFW